MRKFTFYLETYGCKINQYESQLIREAWLRHGTEASKPELADYIIINSCAITGKAERDSRGAVFRARRKAPCASIILTGCAAQLFPDFTPCRNSIYYKPDYCVTQADKATLLAGPEGFAQKSETSADAFMASGISTYYRGRPIIKIQDGCSQKCSYCIVPSTRNALNSKSPETIFEECSVLAQNGYSELVLSGINLRQYKNNGDFWDLLGWLDKKLSACFPGKLRLRISSLDPGFISARALDILANTSLVCPHLHLSLQHISASMLKSMGRPAYDAKDIHAAIASLSKKWPIMGLGADILVGFPGETEFDIRELEDFLQEIPLTYAHVFPYSRRPGTRAALLPGQIGKKEKLERASHIRAITEQKKKAFLLKMLGQPRMAIAPDLRTASGHGVNEYYVSCYFDAAKTGRHTASLFTAIPKRINYPGLEVEPEQRNTDGSL